MEERARSIPSVKGFDHTFAFLREGYEFVSRRCDSLGSDFVRARLMLKPVICARGASAAEMFYGGNRLTRQGGAMPPTVLRLLQDKGSVQQLDGSAHHHRKSLFVDLLMNEKAEAEFVELFRDEWLQTLSQWAERPSIVLFDEANLVLTRTICRWMDVPLDAKGDEEMTRELSSMIENAGSIGPAVLVALWRRRKTERLIVELVEKLRNGIPEDLSSSPLASIASFRDVDGAMLSTEAAAVEILNILRPTVAIGRYIMFAAMALKDNPRWRESLHGADSELYESFAEEVRRLYPFFPVIGGIARKDFEWDGYGIAQGDWVLLDLHGTNHDPRLFPDPHSFESARPISWRDQDYAFVPQGAGQTRENHRCPGEQFTVAAIREAARLLVEDMEYAVPEQDFSMPLNHMPARPRSGMILANIKVRRRAAATRPPNRTGR